MNRDQHGRNIVPGVIHIMMKAFESRRLKPLTVRRWDELWWHSPDVRDRDTGEPLGPRWVRQDRTARGGWIFTKQEPTK